MVGEEHYYFENYEVLTGDVSFSLDSIVKTICAIFFSKVIAKKKILFYIVLEFVLC